MFYYESKVNDCIYISNRKLTYSETYWEDLGANDHFIGEFENPVEFLRYFKKRRNALNDGEDRYSLEHLSKVTGLSKEKVKEIVG